MKLPRLRVGLINTCGTICLVHQVTPLLRLRVRGISPSDVPAEAAAQLSLWNPPEALLEWLQCGVAFSLTGAMVQEVVSCGGAIQLSAGRNASVQQLVSPPGEALLQLVSEPRDLLTPARALSLVHQQQHRQQQYREYDVRGLVAAIEPLSPAARFQNIYLTDHSEVVLTVRVWDGLKEQCLDSLLRSGEWVELRNLQLRGTPTSAQSTILLHFTELSEAMAVSRREAASLSCTKTLLQAVRPRLPSVLIEAAATASPNRSVGSLSHSLTPRRSLQLEKMRRLDMVCGGDGGAGSVDSWIPAPTAMSTPRVGVRMCGLRRRSLLRTPTLLQPPNTGVGVATLETPTVRGCLHFEDESADNNAKPKTDWLAPSPQQKPDSVLKEMQTPGQPQASSLSHRRSLTARRCTLASGVRRQWTPAAAGDNNTLTNGASDLTGGAPSPMVDRKRHVAEKSAPKNPELILEDSIADVVKSRRRSCQK